MFLHVPSWTPFVKLLGSSTVQRRCSSTPPPSPWAAYPENDVEYAEEAGAFLRRVFNKKQLVDDLKGHPDFQQRFELALSECLVMLKEIGKRVTQGRGEEG